jgi:hypothetical protein
MDIFYKQGDLFVALKERTEEKPLFIPHIVNNHGAWGSGFVVPLGRAFPEAKERYLHWASNQLVQPPFQLGEVQFVVPVKFVCVCNMLAQTLGGKRPLYYNHLARCMDAVAEKTEKTGGQIWAPMFGSGLAGGDWNFIEQLIGDSWLRRGLPVTIFHLEDLS